MKGGNYNVKTISQENQDVEARCQGLVCSAKGEEYVSTKLGHRVITIWACKKCAKQLR